MATIKSYTDIEQSKVLAKMLPIESADMIWDLTIPDLPTARVIPYEDSDYNNKHLNIITAWSLAALLDIIPQEIFDGEYIINITEGLNNRWILTYDNSKKRNHSLYGLSSCANNLVDACYEMILKLHEHNLL